MQHDRAQAQPIELTREIPSCAITFDTETASLDGVYGDEISLFRARRVWKETLESSFLLEEGSDYKFTLERSIRSGRFALRADFHSACGRYAFWRITNQQAPEAQYLLETAHIPLSEQFNDEFSAAPDMRSIRKEYLSHVDGSNEYGEPSTSLRDVLRHLMKHLRK